MLEAKGTKVWGGMYQFMKDLKVPCRPYRCPYEDEVLQSVEGNSNGMRLKVRTFE